VPGDEPAPRPPAEPGWYGGVHAWRGEECPAPLHWDGARWSFDGPGGGQPEPVVVRYLPRRCDSFGGAAVAAFGMGLEDAA
jgi:hypothetical protein